MEPKPCGGKSIIVYVAGSTKTLARRGKKCVVEKDLTSTWDIITGELPKQTERITKERDCPYRQEKRPKYKRHNNENK